MKLKRIAWIYLVSYLGIGGIGFAFFPTETQKLFYSNADYGEIMPRLVGVFMCLLSYLIYNFYKNRDWKYYIITIYARIPVVLFIFYIYYISSDPMFLIIDGIVILGLILTITGHVSERSSKETS